MSFRSLVYLPVGSKAGGWVDRTGIEARGSPIILRTIRYRSGKSPSTGRTFFATGLYFFFVAAKVARGARGREIGSERLETVKAKADVVEVFEEVWVEVGVYREAKGKSEETYCDKK